MGTCDEKGHQRKGSQRVTRTRGAGIRQLEEQARFPRQSSVDMAKGIKAGVCIGMVSGGVRRYGWSKGCQGEW